MAQEPKGRTGTSDSDMHDMERITRLVAVVCVALVWAYLVGEHKDMNIKNFEIRKSG